MNFVRKFLNKLEESEETTARTVLCITSFGILIPLILTWKIWTTERIYPLTPVFKVLEQIDGQLSIAIFILGNFFLILALFRKFTVISIAIFFTIVIFWILQDLSRGSIWLYMYNWILLCLFFFFIKLQKSGADSGYINNIRAIICGTYIWGGINKVNVYFYGKTFPWFISPIIPNILDYKLGILFVILIPFFEIAIGATLFFNSTRKIGIFLSACMLITNLVCLGPLGHNWANRVWPWNVAIFLFVVFLFSKEKPLSLKEILLPKTFLTAPVLFFIYIAPILWHFNSWPINISFHMYTGTKPQALFVVKKHLLQKLPIELQKIAGEKGNFYLSDWADSEMNSAAQKIRVVFDNVASTLCGYTGKTSGVKMIIRHKPKHPFDANRKFETVYPCTG